MPSELDEGPTPKKLRDRVDSLACMSDALEILSRVAEDDETIVTAFAARWACSPMKFPLAPVRSMARCMIHLTTQKASSECGRGSELDRSLDRHGAVADLHQRSLPTVLDGGT
jgi:hypothetical protein